MQGWKEFIRTAIIFSLQSLSIYIIRITMQVAIAGGRKMYAQKHTLRLNNKRRLSNSHFPEHTPPDDDKYTIIQKDLGVLVRNFSTKKQSDLGVDKYVNRKESGTHLSAINSTLSPVVLAKNKSTPTGQQPGKIQKEAVPLGSGNLSPMKLKQKQLAAIRRKSVQVGRRSGIDLEMIKNLHDPNASNVEEVIEDPMEDLESPLKLPASKKHSRESPLKTKEFESPDPHKIARMETTNIPVKQKPKVKQKSTNRSLFIFKQNSIFRIWVKNIIEHRIMEYVILFVIFLSSLCLACEDYSDRDSITKRNQFLDNCQTAFTWIFTLECAMKVVAYGFIFHKGSYLRDAWNLIDFVVVVTGILEEVVGGQVKLKSLRVLRVLRPLKGINAIPSMRKLVGALLQAMPDFIHIGAFLLFIFILFSILGTHQYNGMLYNRCRLTQTPINSTYWPWDPESERVCSQSGLGLYTCPTGEYCGNPQDYGIDLYNDGVFYNEKIYFGITTFDDIPASLLTVMIIIFEDDWTHIMLNIMDADIPYLACFYGVMIVVIGSFFLMNLILAVIIQAFITIQQQLLENEIGNLENKQGELHKLNFHQSGKGEFDEKEEKTDFIKPVYNEPNSAGMPRKSFAMSFYNAFERENNDYKVQGPQLSEIARQESRIREQQILEEKEGQERKADFSFLNKVSKANKILSILLRKTPQVEQPPSSEVEGNNPQDQDKDESVPTKRDEEEGQRVMSSNPNIEIKPLDKEINVLDKSADRSDFDLDRSDPSKANNLTNLGGLNVNDDNSLLDQSFDPFVKKKTTLLGSRPDSPSHSSGHSIEFQPRNQLPVINITQLGVQQSTTPTFPGLVIDTTKPKLRSILKAKPTETPTFLKPDGIGIIRERSEEYEQISSFHQDDPPQIKITITESQNKSREDEDEKENRSPFQGLGMAMKNMLASKQDEVQSNQMNYFNQVLREHKDNYLSENKLKSKTTLRQMATVRLGLKIKRKQGDIGKEIEKMKIQDRAEKNALYKICYNISFSNKFTTLISLSIILNTVVLALDRYPIDPKEESIENDLNSVFTFIFIFEMIIRQLGLGLKGYFRDPFNCFDVVIVVTSVIDFVFQVAMSTSSGGAVTAMRAFRLIRIFKLAKSWKKFQNLLKAIGKTLKDVSTFSVLLFLFMFTYTLLGLEIFAYKTSPNNDDAEFFSGTALQTNFNSFLNAFTGVFICLTNDAWTGIYFKYWRIAGGVSTFFFLTLIVIGQKILLNLFLAILLENFDEVSLNEELKDQLRDKQFQKQTTFFRQVLDLITMCCQKRCKRVKKAIKRRIDPDSDDDNQESSSSNFDFDDPMLSGKTMLNDQTSNRTNMPGDSNRRPSIGDLNKSDKQIKRRGANKFQSDDKPKIFGIALGLFSQKNRFRSVCFTIVTSNKFDYFIILMIVMSGIQLALENPLNDPNGYLNYILNNIDYATTTIFALECVMKMIAFGFLFNGKFSYLRNTWNSMDFTIIVFSCLSLSPLSNDFSIFKLFRVIRCLRLVSKNEGLQLAVKALLTAIPQIANLILIMVLFFLIFSIIAISYFKGMFYNCYTSDEMIFWDEISSEVNTKWDCLNAGGDWLKPGYSFDNIYIAMVTLFQMSTMQGWAIVMYSSLATTGVDQMPRNMNNPYWVIFFILFIIIGSFFLLNLFVGVVISTFNRQKEKIGGNNLLTDRQKEWIDAKITAIRAKPLKLLREPNNRFRKVFYKIQDNIWFERFIFFSIFANTIVLFIIWSDMPATVSTVTNDINQIFTAVFILEAIIKIIGTGTQYFKDSWNRFDFFIVVGSVISMFLTYISSLSLGGATTIIRAFRISRVVRLVKRARNLRLAFNTFIYTIPALVNTGGLLLLLLYLYSVLGVFLCSEIKHNGYLTDTLNFEKFTSSFITLFSIATYDNWSTALYSITQGNQINFQCINNPTYQDYINNDRQTIGCGLGFSGVLFLFSYIFFVNIIFLNLFIAIILQGFEETQAKENKLFNQETLEHFRKVWAKYDPDATTYIKVSQLRDVLFDLGGPLGWDESYIGNPDKQGRYLAGIDIQCKNFNEYRFFDVLEALALRLVVQQLVNKQKEDEEEDSLMEEDFDQKRIDTMQKEEEMKKEIEQDLNKIEFQDHMKHIQAVKEMDKKHRRISEKHINVADGAQINNFNTKQLATATIAVAQWRYRVKKNKFLREKNGGGTSDKPFEAKTTKKVVDGDDDRPETPEEFRVTPTSSMRFESAQDLTSKMTKKKTKNFHNSKSHEKSKFAPVGTLGTLLKDNTNIYENSVTSDSSSSDSSDSKLSSQSLSLASNKEGYTNSIKKGIKEQVSPLRPIKRASCMLKIEEDNEAQALGSHREIPPPFEEQSRKTFQDQTFFIKPKGSEYELRVNTFKEHLSSQCEENKSDMNTVKMDEMIESEYENFRHRMQGSNMSLNVYTLENSRQQKIKDTSKTRSQLADIPRQNSSQMQLTPISQQIEQTSFQNAMGIGAPSQAYAYSHTQGQSQQQLTSPAKSYNKNHLKFAGSMGGTDGWEEQEMDEEMTRQLQQQFSKLPSVRQSRSHDLGTIQEFNQEEVKASSDLNMSKSRSVKDVSMLSHQMTKDVDKRTQRLFSKKSMIATVQEQRTLLMNQEILQTEEMKVEEDKNNTSSSGMSQDQP